MSVLARLSRRIAGVALGLLTVLSGDASATLVAAFEFSQPARAAATATGNDALYFTPTTDILVSALGMYDHDQDGLTQQHDVGLYRISGST
ncbi:MAG: hypothetical protein GY953_07485 [bacterium]|nr:hypothetical protein [bacterium]